MVYKTFQNFGIFFTSPIGNNWIADLQNEVMSAKLSEIEANCVLLPYKDKQIALPFTDSVW